MNTPNRRLLWDALRAEAAGLAVAAVVALLAIAALVGFLAT